jgi:hypothetical protein
MITCTKCNIEKTEDNYATYFHSSQQKMRTRKICKSCFNEQKKLYRSSIKNKKITQPQPPELEIEPIIDYSNNKNYRQCNTCSTWKELDKYYCSNGKPTSNRCIVCTREKERLDSIENMKLKGGSDMVPKLPNKYFDEYQRSNTFEVMKLLGYLYDEETGIWTKSGWKEIKDGKAFFPHLRKRKPKPKPPKEVFIKKVSPEFYEKIMMYKEKGLKRYEIASLLNTSPTTITNTIKKYETKTH